MRLKIIQKTPLQLKLKLQAAIGGFAYWFFGGIFITLGLFTLIALGKSTSLVCDRTGSVQDSCKLTQSSLLTSNVQDISLQDLKGAKVDTHTIEKSFPLVLLTPKREIRFNLIMVDGNQKEELVTQINRFISNSAEKTLAIKEDARWFGYSLGSFVIVVGLICILVIETITLSMDKTFDKLTIEQGGWFGTQLTKESLREILKLDMEALNVRGATSYNVILVLRSGKRLPVASHPLFTQKSAEATCVYIQEFLHPVKSRN